MTAPEKALHLMFNVFAKIDWTDYPIESSQSMLYKPTAIIHCVNN